MINDGLMQNIIYRTMQKIMVSRLSFIIYHLSFIIYIPSVSLYTYSGEGPEE